MPIWSFRFSGCSSSPMAIMQSTATRIQGARLRKDNFSPARRGRGASCHRGVSGVIRCVFSSSLWSSLPGCGMTRALAALAGGDPASAIAFHPLVPVVPFLAIASFSEGRTFPCAVSERRILSACAACFVAVWMVRMFALFPRHAAYGLFTLVARVEGL